VELGECLAPRPEQFLPLDLPVLILVGAREAFLLAALGACFGGLELGGGGCQRGAIRPSRWGRWQAGALLGSRLPQQECPGEEEEAGGDAGKKTTHEISF